MSRRVHAFMPGCARPRGFTLVEVLVSLALTGLLLVLAHAVFTAIADGSERASKASRDALRWGNRYAWLVRAFGSAQVGSLPQRGFHGLNRMRDALEADELRFAATIRVGAEYEVRNLRFGLDNDRRLVAELRLPPGPRDARPDSLVLSDPLVAFGADYLLEYGARARWINEWISPVSAPVAVRLRLGLADGQVDTLLLHVGTRG